MLEKWHVIVSGDNCYQIETDNGITMAQFQKWNPQLDNDCSNLLLNDAYCVQGDIDNSSRKRGLPAHMPAVPSGAAAHLLRHAHVPVHERSF